MTTTSRLEQALVQRVADRYRKEGFEVVVGPKNGACPFDLEDYLPDLIATRGNERLMVEVRKSSEGATRPRLVEAARRVREHPPWQLLLVTEDDDLFEPAAFSHRPVPSWPELRQGMLRCERVAAAGEPEAALLSRWALLEGMLRRCSLDEALPFDGLRSDELVRQTYSYGLVSGDHFDELLRLHPIRNQVAHGFVAANAAAADADLRTIVDAVWAEWARPVPEAAAATSS